MPRTARLSRDDWAAAALDALAEGGLSAVAVEPVAARLGASKSSFYWLFENRQALLEAALERWERLQTEAVVVWVTKIADPAERLRRLVHQAFATPGAGDLALRLLTASDEPAVRSVVARVTRRRLDVIEAAFAELGHPSDLARHYAMVGYSAYLGAAALRRVDISPEDTHAYVDAALAPFGVPPGAP